MAKAKYRVISPIQYKGKLYIPGEVIELEEEQSIHLKHVITPAPKSEKITEIEYEPELDEVDIDFDEIEVESEGDEESPSEETEEVEKPKATSKNKGGRPSKKKK